MRIGNKVLVGTAILVLSVLSPAQAETEVTVATYNIKFLNASKLGNQGNREQKLEDVIEQLDADVIALQEIKDRDALEKIFNKSDWHLVIDDDSGNDQDVAVAVRKPLEVPNVGNNLDADDDDFLFPGSANNHFFPRRRDVLVVDVRVPSEDVSFTVMVMHTKARVGGRTTTEPRRVGASIAMLQKLEQDFDGERYIVLGDYNDTPDDRSLNVLETGNASAGAGADSSQGPFLFNLTEELYNQGHVTFGRNTSDINGDNLDTVDPQARTRNLTNLGNDAHTGDQMFDQLLVSPELFADYVPDSAEVFAGADAASGNNKTRASDHLPVSAMFLFGADNSVVVDVVFVSAVPNPAGTDGGNEQVTLRNTTADAVDLDGWTITDIASNTRDISGTVAAGASITITLSGKPMLNNSSGDSLNLIRSDDSVADTSSYDGPVASGESVDL